MLSLDHLPFGRLSITWYDYAAKLDLTPALFTRQMQYLSPDPSQAIRYEKDKTVKYILPWEYSLSRSNYISTTQQSVFLIIGFANKPRFTS